MGKARLTVKDLREAIENLDDNTPLFAELYCERCGTSYENTQVVDIVANKSELQLYTSEEL